MAKKHHLPADGVSTSAGEKHDADSNKTRGLHIFSHFGIPKQVSHVVVGNVHPAIIKLGVQFSSFKICGANARCIATLTAFKSVRMLHQTSQIVVTARAGHSRLQDPTQYDTFTTSYDPPLPTDNSSCELASHVCDDGKRNSPTQA
jgi:hypothetical protein